MTEGRFYEPVKVGATRDYAGCGGEDDDESWGSSRDVYAVRPHDHGRTLGSELKLNREQADHLCDILEQVRETARQETVVAA